MLLYCVQDMTLTLYRQLFNHVIEKLQSSPMNDVTFIDWCQFMVSCNDKFSSNLSKDQFREIRKCLESIYVQQPNQPQTNNVTEGGKESQAMHAHEDYQNCPYQPPTLTPDQQQRIEEDLVLMTRIGVYPFEYMDSLNDFKSHSYHPKTPSISH